YNPSKELHFYFTTLPVYYSMCNVFLLTTFSISSLIISSIIQSSGLPNLAACVSETTKQSCKYSAPNTSAQYCNPACLKTLGGHPTNFLVLDNTHSFITLTEALHIILKKRREL